MKEFLYPEQRNPCGQAGLLVYFGNTDLPYRPKREVNHLYVANMTLHGQYARAAGSSWWIVIWEMLTAKVPGPNLATPWCCYTNTVVFYAQPKIERQFGYVWRCGEKYEFAKRGSSLEKYAELQHTLIGNDIVLLDNRLFRVGGGRVVWHGHRWWIRQSARLVE